MGLKTLGGCLSTGSTTTNTSSSNSTVSECRAGLLRPLGGCASCSSETAGGGFESPAAFRKKLVGGCLPCAPLASSAPLRALQSCVSGCNPKASQTASSTCSYCSSDPIVVTFNPHRGKQQQPPLHGSGRGGGGGGGGFAGSSHDDDDYSVRTIWPEELAKKMTRSKTQGNHHNMGAGCSGGGHEQNGGHTSNPVILDCRNLLEFTRSQLTDHAGRRRLQQGKSAVLDFIGSGGPGSRDSGRDSLKRLWTTGGDVGMMGDSNGLDDEMSRSPSPRAPSSAPQSPPSFSPPPSAHGTLIKPKPRQRDREGGHSLPSAQSLHLVLNSLNQEQDEENGRGKVHGKACCIPLCLSVWLTVCLSVRIPVCRFVCLSLWIPVCLSVWLPGCCLSICLPTHLFVCLAGWLAGSLSLFVCLDPCLSVGLDPCLSVCVSICLSICLSLSFPPSLHFSITCASLDSLTVSLSSTSAYCPPLLTVCF